jgi:acyl-coenzyme A thioesterase PaaI-like protein
MCDVSMYAAIFGAVGHDAMALTATLTIHFLSRAPIEPLICETRVVKLGRRVVFLDSLIHAEAGGGPVVQATGSYLRSPG